MCVWVPNKSLKTRPKGQAHIKSSRKFHFLCKFRIEIRELWFLFYSSCRVSDAMFSVHYSLLCRDLPYAVIRKIHTSSGIRNAILHRLYKIYILIGNSFDVAAMLASAALRRRWGEVGWGRLGWVFEGDWNGKSALVKIHWWDDEWWKLDNEFTPFALPDGVQYKSFYSRHRYEVSVVNAFSAL